MRYFKHTIFPLLFAVAIYLLFRSKVFMLVTGADFPGLYAFLKNLQQSFIQIKSVLPGWFLYSLPDGLWTYAFTSYFVIRLKNDLGSSVRTFALYFTPLLSIFFELGQHFHITPGTFDFVDLAFDTLGSVLPFVLHSRNGLLDRLSCPTSADMVFNAQDN